MYDKVAVDPPLCAGIYFGSLRGSDVYILGVTRGVANAHLINILFDGVSWDMLCARQLPPCGDQSQGRLVSNSQPVLNMSWRWAVDLTVQFQMSTLKNWDCRVMLSRLDLGRRR